jgi:hypothetical protein
VDWYYVVPGYDKRRKMGEHEMEINALHRLKVELESFKLVTTSNMVGAALTLAYSIAFGFTKIIPFITGSPLEAVHLPYLLVVGSGFATAISWITRSAELMGEHDEIVKELDEIIIESKSTIGDNTDFDEKIIGIIVRSLAFYRENSTKIDRLKWGGRLTGTFMLIMGIPQLISFLTGSYPVNGVYMLAQGFAVVLSFGISIAAWYVPVIIKRFMDKWDARLKLAEDANVRLSKILEDNG